MDQQTEEKKKDQTERVIGLGRRTREEIVKWNQTTALRFQAVGGGCIRYPRQISPASLWGREKAQKVEI